MKIGKLPEEVLKSVILDKLNHKRAEVVVRPGIGEDCCALDLGNKLCILTSDPVTGTDKQTGIIAVHVCCNDIAASGAEPIGLLVTLLLPPYFTEDGIKDIMAQITRTAELLNIDIIGGHTEVTDAVNRPVISGTAVGKVLRDRLVTSSGAKDGDVLIMTKTAGIEGTAILANDHSELLAGIYGDNYIKRAKSFINRISVVKEGIIASGFDINAMHDATEGGVIGAAWEIAEASGLGLEINAVMIPIAEETAVICRHFNISPIKLISSGCMLITCGKATADMLVPMLNTNDIDAVVIGKFDNTGKRISIVGDTIEVLSAPQPDELYNLTEKDS